MAKVKSSVSTKFKFVLSFITLLFFILHFWILFILTNGFTRHPVYNFILSILFFCGFLLIPMGYLVSHKIPKSNWYFMAWIGYIWLGVFFISLWVSTLYFIIVTFFPYLQMNSYYLIIFIIILSTWSLYKGLQDPIVRIQKVKARDNLGPLRIVHITDLHVGLLRHNKAWLERIVSKINHLDADFVVLTGDLVEGKWDSVFPMIKPLIQINAKVSKIFVSGNHEFIHGGMIWEKAIQDMGWTILHNENRVFNFNGKKILLAGVPDRMIRRFDKNLESNPDEALKTDEKVDFKILLAHEPASVWDLKNEVPDIILSGHTHGGQIFPFNGLVRLVQPVVAGWKRIKGIMVYAHPGTGLWGPPMRLGSESQIVLLEF